MPVVFIDTAASSLTNTRSYLATANASADGQLAASDAALKSSLLATTAIVEKAIATILGVFNAKSKDASLVTVSSTSGTSYSSVSAASSAASSGKPEPTESVLNITTESDGVFSAVAHGSLVYSTVAAKAIRYASSTVNAGLASVVDYVTPKVMAPDGTTVTNTDSAKAVSSLAATLDNTNVNLANSLAELETRLLADAVAKLPKFVPSTAVTTTFTQELASYATFLNTLTSIQKMAYMKSNSIQYNIMVSFIKAGLEQAKTSGVALTEADVRNLLTIINASGNGSDIALSTDDFKVISDTKTARAKAVADETIYNEIKGAVVDFLISKGQTAAATDFSNIGLDEATVTTIRSFLEQTSSMINIQEIDTELVRTFNVADFVNEINKYYASPNEKVSYANRVSSNAEGKSKMGEFILAKIISQISSLTAKDKSVARNTALGTQLESLTSAKKQDATDPLNYLIDSVLGYILG